MRTSLGHTSALCRTGCCSYFFHCAKESAGDASLTITTDVVEAEREVVLVRNARVLADTESKRRQILREAAGVACC